MLRFLTLENEHMEHSLKGLVGKGEVEVLDDEFNYS